MKYHFCLRALGQKRLWELWVFGFWTERVRIRKSENTMRQGIKKKKTQGSRSQGVKVLLSVLDSMIFTATGITENISLFLSRVVRLQEFFLSPYIPKYWKHTCTQFVNDFLSSVIYAFLYLFVFSMTPRKCKRLIRMT